MRSSIVSATLVGAALLVGARSASAQGYFEVGGFGSAARFDRTLPFNNANAGGARLSFGSGSGAGLFVLEGEGSYFSLGKAPFQLRYIPVRARLLYTPTFGPLGIMMGGGAVRTDYSSVATPSSHTSELGYTGLAGLRLSMGNYLALRVEGVLDYMTHPFNASPTLKRTTNRSVQAGLSFPLWVSRPVEKEKPQPVHQSQPVRESGPTIIQMPAQMPAAAPAVPVQQTALPDADHDGVPDIHDMCPNTAPGSTVDAQGCAVFRDTDGDGVIDQRDACPNTPLGEKVDGRGCTLVADTDRDGVPDDRDQCPNTQPGIAVKADGCPMPVAAAPAPAPVAVAPAPEPDADRDGVPDSRDQCPGTPPGTAVDMRGCVPPLFTGTTRTVTLRGVNFEPWKDELKAGSTAILDDVARQLVDAPSVRVEVGGYTDSNGSPSRNLRLSLARAEVVRAYLVMKGVSPERLVARGYGPAHPVTGNGTAAGRAMNRRVELKRID